MVSPHRDIGHAHTLPAGRRPIKGQAATRPFMKTVPSSFRIPTATEIL
jgi:hypothetical protein